MSRIKHYNLEEVVTMWAQTRQNGDSDDRRWDVGGAGPEGLAKDGHEAGTGNIFITVDRLLLLLLLK